MLQIPSCHIKICSGKRVYKIASIFQAKVRSLVISDGRAELLGLVEGLDS